MTPEILKQVGTALYGPRWQTDLAEALNVSGRTLRYWIAGANPIPPGIQSELAKICQEREEELFRLVALLQS